MRPTQPLQFISLEHTYDGVRLFEFVGERFDFYIGNSRHATIGAVQVYGHDDFYWLVVDGGRRIMKGFVHCSDEQFRYALDYNEFVRKPNPFNHLHRLEPFPPCFFFEAFWVWAQWGALAADGDHAIAYRVMRCLFMCKA